MKKILKWGGITLVVLFIIGLIGSNGSKGTSQSNQPNSGSTGTQDEPKKDTSKPEQVAGLNQPVTDGDLSFTVLSVEKKKSVGNAYTKKDSQGMFYIVSLKLENTGKKTVTFDSSMAKVTDSEGREFDRSIEGQTALGMSTGKVDLFLQQIQPSLSYTGDLVFDLPAEVQNPVLVVKGSLFNKGAKIQLQ